MERERGMRDGKEDRGRDRGMRDRRGRERGMRDGKGRGLNKGPTPKIIRTVDFPRHIHV